MCSGRNEPLYSGPSCGLRDACAKTLCKQQIQATTGEALVITLLPRLLQPRTTHMIGPSFLGLSPLGPSMIVGSKGQRFADCHSDERSAVARAYAAIIKVGRLQQRRLLQVCEAIRDNGRFCCCWRPSDELMVWNVEKRRGQAVTRPKRLKIAHKQRRSTVVSE